MIRCLVSGTLHGEPQARTSSNGNTFALAKVKADDKNGNWIWISAIAFGEQAERLLLLKAGDAVAISGRAELGVWTDKDGNAHSSLSLVAEEVAALRAKPKTPPQEQARRPASRRRYQNNPPVAAESAPPFDDPLDF